MSAIEVTIFEQGNGFPNVGDILIHNDGRTFRLIETSNCIHTGRASGNFILGVVEETVSDEEPFAARIEFE